MTETVVTERLILRLPRESDFCRDLGGPGGCALYWWRAAVA